MLNALDLPATPQRQRGASILEALIAILIFSGALLGLMGMQAASIRNVADAKYRSDASFLAQSIIGQMWLDKGNLSSYAGTYPAKTAWLNQVQSLLPNGNGTIAVVGNDVTVTVTWQPPNQPQHSHVVTTTIQHNW